MTDFLETNGARIAYDTEGDGEPVVLIHAGVANRSMWDDQVAALRDAYRVIRYDTRGYGETTTEKVSFSNRADIAALLDHLGETSAHIVGLSRGGMIALDFTVESPERVRSLAVVAGGISGYESPDEVPAETFEPVEAMWKAKEWEALTDWETAFWADGPGQSPDRAPGGPSAASATGCSRTTAPRRRRASRSRSTRRPSVVWTPSGCRCSSCSARSTIRARSSRCASSPSRVPGARLEELEAAHMVNLEHPDRFNRILREHLDGASGR